MLYSCCRRSGGLEYATAAFRRALPRDAAQAGGAGRIISPPRKARHDPPDFGKPVLAGIFLAVNGVILIAGERYRTRASLAADAAVAAREPAELLVAAGRPPGSPAERETE